MQSFSDQADLGVVMTMVMHPIINDTLSAVIIINLFLPVGRRVGRLALTGAVRGVRLSRHEVQSIVLSRSGGVRVFHSPLSRLHRRGLAALSLRVRSG